MTTAGFWTEGSDEHRRAVEKQIATLRQRLQHCKPAARAQITEEIDQAVEELKRCDDCQILW